MHVLGTPPAFVLSQDQTLNKFVSHPVSRLKPFIDRCFQLSKELQSPFSGAYLHKHLTLFNLQGTIVGAISAPFLPPRGGIPFRFVAPPLRFKPISLGFESGHGSFAISAPFLPPRGADCQSSTFRPSCQAPDLSQFLPLSQAAPFRGGFIS